jgi:4-hydroxy-3-methylbut-2-enyl diphosphate reductase
MKKDMSPTILSFEGLEILLARHFGFCFGVENAVEIAYQTIENNRGKRIFLLSQMIHNPVVNDDLESSGLRFILDTDGNQLIPWSEINKDDIVIIPAFGVSLENKKILEEIGVDLNTYDTTCPFVEKVWKTSEKLGSKEFTTIIHGKEEHEETRATFSRAKENGAALVIRDLDDADFIANLLIGKESESDFKSRFEGRYSRGFESTKDLVKVGVVNQTTMLASETQEIANKIKQGIADRDGKDRIKESFSDTRDTLCYATNDNQSATLSLLDYDSDFVVVVGGRNSSNTSHLVELLEEKFPCAFIRSEHDLSEDLKLTSFNIHTKETEVIDLAQADLNKIIITSGASCPDLVVERVIQKLLLLKGIEFDYNQVLNQVKKEYGF